MSLFLTRTAACSAAFVEATSGFEPLNRGFADLYSAQDHAQMTPIDHP